MSKLLNKTITKAGITYNSLHWWIRKTLGSATECENTKCLKESTYFDWALKKGKQHDKKKSNYWQLCRKCHFKYDDKYKKLKFDIGRKLGQKARIGSHHSKEIRQKIKDSLKKRFPNGRIVWNKGKAWSEETKKKMSLARMGKTPWNKGKKLR